MGQALCKHITYTSVLNPPNKLEIGVIKKIKVQ